MIKNYILGIIFLHELISNFFKHSEKFLLECTIIQYLGFSKTFNHLLLKNKFILKRHWLVALAFIYIKECLDIIDLYDMYNITKLFFPPKCSSSISHKHFVHPFYYPFYNSPIYLEYIFFSPFDKTKKKNLVGKLSKKTVGTD